jgi:hypothetical protein
MYMHEKSYQFSNVFSPLRFESELPVERVHKWVMANLPAGSREEIRGLFPATTPTQIGAETNNRFALHRYKTFIHGIVEFHGMLYEFLPGMVRVYACLPDHLMQRSTPAIGNFPGLMHVMYPPAAPMARQYWQDVQSQKLVPVSTRMGLHFETEVMPPINGAIIRNIFSIYARFLRRLQDQETPDGSTRDHIASKALWMSLVRIGQGGLGIAQTPVQERYLRDLRDGMHAFDPSNEHLQRLWRAAIKLDGSQPDARALGAAFYTLLREELGALAKK